MGSNAVYYGALSTEFKLALGNWKDSMTKLCKCSKYNMHSIPADDNIQ